MPLAAGSGRRERVLVMGFSGSGKSTTWLTVAEWLHKTKSTAKVFVLDNDRAWDAARPLDGHLDDVVKVWQVDTWEEHRNAIREMRKEIDARKGNKPVSDDWLVVDMADKIWAGTQNAYWQIAYKKEIDEIYLDVEMSDFNMAGDHGKNWNVINKMYDSIWSHVSRAGCHVLVVTAGDEVRENNRAGKGGDKPEIQKAFGKYGIKPAGQKRLGNEFHTILLAQDTPSAYSLTSVKERNPPDRVDRENLVNVPMKEGGFVMAYLVKIAKWKMGR